MTTQETIDYLNRLNEKKQLLRSLVIKQRRIVNLIEQVYFRSKKKHNSLVKEYMSLDREYALEKYRLETQEMKNKEKDKPKYNCAKKTLEKALKALERLPKELRERILLDMKDDVF